MEGLYCFNFFITNTICCDSLNLIEFILLCLRNNQYIMLSVQQNYVLLEDAACFRLSNLSLGYIFSMTHKITTEIAEVKKTANQNIIISVQYNYIFLENATWFGLNNASSGYVLSLIHKTTTAIIETKSLSKSKHHHIISPTLYF
jgi:hypothetical protein